MSLSLLALAPVSLAQTSRHPTDAEACFDAAERAQPLLKDHKLRAAARELAVCARDACPRAARGDCRAWLDELARAQPTVVIRARESRPSGDVAVDDVRVLVDGEPLVTQGLDETPVPIDPGTRTLRFEHPGFPAVEQRIELREGESRRIVDVVFRAADAGAASPSGGSLPSTTPSASPRGAPPPAADVADHEAADVPVPAPVWALLGGGALALGLGVTFEAIGLSSRSHLADTCGPTRACSQSDVDSARSQVLVGDVGLGVGAALLVGAAWVYLARGPSAPASSGLRLGVRPVAGGLAGALEGSL